jgi:hypothetical protein
LTKTSFPTSKLLFGFDFCNVWNVIEDLVAGSKMKMGDLGMLLQTEDHYTKHSNIKENAPNITIDDCINDR